MLWRGSCIFSERKSNGIFDKNDMSETVLSRRKAREILLGLLFESEFKADEDYVEIYALSSEQRLIPEDRYIKEAYFVINENRASIDELISRNAKSWRVDRLSKMSRCLLRLGAYEMVYEKEIPFSVTINEVIELTKTYDDPKARAFVNGVLNGMKDELSGSEIKEEQ